MPGRKWASRQGEPKAAVMAEQAAEAAKQIELESAE